MDTAYKPGWSHGWSRNPDIVQDIEEVGVRRGTRWVVVQGASEQEQGRVVDLDQAVDQNRFRQSREPVLGPGPGFVVVGLDAGQELAVVRPPGDQDGVFIADILKSNYDGTLITRSYHAFEKFKFRHREGSYWKVQFFFLVLA